MNVISKSGPVIKRGLDLLLLNDCRHKFNQVQVAASECSSALLVNKIRFTKYGYQFLCGGGLEICATAGLIYCNTNGHHLNVITNSALTIGTILSKIGFRYDAYGTEATYRQSIADYMKTQDDLETLNKKASPEPTYERNADWWQHTTDE